MSTSVWAVSFGGWDCVSTERITPRVLLSCQSNFDMINFLL
jgi:hypothetical protein